MPYSTLDHGQSECFLPSETGPTRPGTRKLHSGCYVLPCDFAAGNLSDVKERGPCVKSVCNLSSWEKPNNHLILIVLPKQPGIPISKSVVLMFTLVWIDPGNSIFIFNPWNIMAHLFERTHIQRQCTESPTSMSLRKRWPWNRNWEG